MNSTKYKWILYTIVAVIIATIGIQVFWNYKNYQSNKRQLINEVQISLDKAVDDYYADLAEKTTLNIFFEDDNDFSSLKDNDKFTNILKNINETDKQFSNLDSIEANSVEGVTIIRGLNADSIMDQRKLKKNTASISYSERTDSIITDSDLKVLTTKVMFSISNDSLDLKQVNQRLSDELNRKQLTVDFNLLYDNGKTNDQPSKIENATVKDSLISKKEFLSTTSKSTFLPKGSTLEVQFSNETKVILKRILGGILISSLLILAVISSLFYLLKIIKHQKQLAEVKNDLISNITHEFKTPIATISAALESISNFNAIDDKAKTKNYIAMSSQQLGKLNTMVEKLLETATLDSDSLELNKEEFDIIALLKDLINRSEIQFPNKAFQVNFQSENLIINADVFHIENALNNILENAVKYGGDTISVELISKNFNFEIFISDTGNHLTKANKERIFEKFYRVPKGNTHDVKGFGIGLYYTKTIIAKHQGSITLELSKGLTTFKISLPHGK
ncbi:two-component system phosphate regulon sensor histidine kinase PhoR [Winogradskyella epiphytica]|uniref:histidine kinase n=1 Tax=Winogradskyella epiphytica TaxID=262005 RepID=A0A2V4XDY9_9FLAO|nr:HAMP domain-containing sensor histidine kinase [Winogradskyella epiphytica]PYE80684.1 two-component system phosphate regulon sensor histidine kinase PhoR [Winogradskyella epiphytica]GGW67709.1 hypothetical protein GCM10008085_19460 [Winogradskyella epiphytica]